MSVVKQNSPLTNWFLPGIFSGLWLTLKKFFGNLIHQEKMPTLNYPEEINQYSPRFKGNHILTVKKDGSLRCTACMLCATACPAECISIVAGEHQDKKVEKYPVRYEIDILRCVFCGFCEEACPVDAVRMGPEWQTPGINGASFVYDIRHLAYRPSLKGGVLSTVDDEERHKSGI
ncbi:MAG: NADH-quinone oxidoreductase subunit I [Proteobacteria bacterium SG_bin7]|nr:MAG: NADH-quinone oxidoreductase subunit I [Proteobacteria bacterium SG_bin7]